MKKTLEQIAEIQAENQIFWRSANGNLIILHGDDGFIFVIEKALLAFNLTNYPTFCHQVQVIDQHYTGFKAEIGEGVEFQFVWSHSRKQFSFAVYYGNESLKLPLGPSDISSLAQKFVTPEPIRHPVTDQELVAYTPATSWERFSCGEQGFDWVTGVLTGNE